MRRSTWRFKKSRFVERSLRRDNLPYTLSMMTMLVAVSCRLSHGSDVHESDSESVTVAVAHASSTPPMVLINERKTLPVVTITSDGATTPLARMIKPECDAPQGEILANVPLATRFGDFAVDIAVTTAKAPTAPAALETVTAAVDGYRAVFPAPSLIGAALYAAACASPNEERVVVDAGVVTSLADVMGRVAPDCERFDAGAHGLTCVMTAADPDSAEQELLGIQTTMIRRWSRQPYLLARRLAIGVTLAQALQSQDNARALDGFCKLIRGALPAELPAALASRRWQAAVCGADPENRADAAAIGLAKTIGEIDAMRQLFESTSRLGHLTVRIPARDFSRKRLLVSLAPETDVAENLAKETQKLWTSPASDVMPLDLPRACWHPLFAEAPELLSLARQLALTGDADQLSCTSPESSPGGPFATERYFAESITSETEFVVTNGNAKTLRLPLGHYRYTIRELPDDPATWDDASQVSAERKGTIAWDAKRPRATISEW